MPPPVYDALPLLPRDSGNTKESVWALEDAESGDRRFSGDHCSRNPGGEGLCCKELREDERTLVDPDVVRDVVIGLSDGLTVPFALTAGLSSLGESKLVVLGGIAELIAGAISMGIGGFLASQAERDHYRYLRQRTSQRVRRSCVGEIERQVSEVLAPVGVDEKTCRAVAKCLREADSDDSSLNGGPASTEVGLTAFLLKFGEGLEEIPNHRMYVSAFTIGIGYLIGGIIPLIPYFFIPRAHIALIYSSLITCIILLIFGTVKARVTGAAQNLVDYVYGAFSTLMVGGIAAAAAFGIVKALEGGGQSV